MEFFYIYFMKRKIITISLIFTFSVLLWIFISFSGEFLININLPIEIIDIPSDLAISSISEQNVNLSLKGNGWILAQHTFGRDPKFNISSPKKIGKEAVSTKNSVNLNNWLSSTLQIMEITPDKVLINIEKLQTKRVEIVPLISLSFKPGYGLVSNLILDPDSVDISGPKSIIEDINFINTKSKYLTKLDSYQTINLELIHPNFTIISANKCSVSFEVQKIVDKTFENLTVETINMPSGYEVLLSPNKVNIILRGGINLLSKMKKEDIKVYIKFQQAVNDTVGALEPTIELPEFTSLVDLKPSSLEYIIQKY